MPFPSPSKSLLSSYWVLGAEIAHEKHKTLIGHSLVCYSLYEMVLYYFLIPILPFQVFVFYYFASISMLTLSTVFLDFLRLLPWSPCTPILNFLICLESSLYPEHCWHMHSLLSKCSFHLNVMVLPFFWL